MIYIFSVHFFGAVVNSFSTEFGIFWGNGFMGKLLVGKLLVGELL